jgi:hypothetical protein
VVTLSGRDAAGKDVGNTLTVAGGTFKKHMSTDLLADKLGRSSDPAMIHTLRLILEDQVDNPFNQTSPANVKKYGSPLECGRVCEGEWNALNVGAMYGGKNDRYHHWLSGTPKDWDEVTYDKKILELAGRTIQRILTDGKPVRVGCTYNPKVMVVQNGDLVVYHKGGHYILIVGCNAAADEFLYLDPYPGMSHLTYDGGITAHDAFTEDCPHLGIFRLQVDTSQKDGRRYLLVRQPNPKGGYLEIVRGPLL